jgi:hypothetical protein
VSRSGCEGAARVQVGGAEESDAATQAARTLGVSRPHKETTMTTKILAALAFGMILSAVAPSAHAETTKKDDNYGYEFKDDILSAPGNDANVGLIKVRPMRTREILTRPRVHFIPEMLKSVENL